VGIPKGHGLSFVAEKLLYGRHVHSGHHEMGCEGVPKVMKPEIDYPRALESRLEAPFDVVIRLTPEMSKHVSVIPLAGYGGLYYRIRERGHIQNYSLPT
jgi:hypothetical protein